LITLGGIFNRKMYVPGETRENEKAREEFLMNGGLHCLLRLYLSE
jgi:hypothetical protein